MFWQTPELMCQHSADTPAMMPGCGIMPSVSDLIRCQICNYSDMDRNKLSIETGENDASHSTVYKDWVIISTQTLLPPSYPYTHSFQFKGMSSFAHPMGSF
jgi:hypothetical protein